MFNSKVIQLLLCRVQSNCGKSCAVFFDKGLGAEFFSIHFLIPLMIDNTGGINHRQKEGC